MSRFYKKWRNAFRPSPFVLNWGLSILGLFLLGQTYGQIDVTEVKSTMAIVGVDYPESETCGNFNLTFQINIQNTGTTALENLEAELDFTDPSFFGTTFQGVVSDPETVFSDANDTPTLNDAYDGSNDLFIGDGRLDPDEKITVEFTIEIDPEAAGAPVNPSIQFEITAFGIDLAGDPIPDPGDPMEQLEVTDLSDDGIDPKTSNPDYPGDTGGEDDPTPLTNCWEQSRVMAANDQVNITLDTDCNVLITPDMIIENHLRDCDEGFPQGGYYRVNLFTGDESGSIPNPFDATAYAGQTIVAIVENVTNHCQPVWGNILLEDKSGAEACIKDVVGVYKNGNAFDPVSNEVTTCTDGVLALTQFDDGSGNLEVESSGLNLLICTDVPFIQNTEASWKNPSYNYFTGSPEFDDNCSDVSILRVRDQLIDFSCQEQLALETVEGRLVESMILRTFYFEDEFGNEGSVEQEIYFFKPQLHLPDCIVELDYCEYKEIEGSNSQEELSPIDIQSIPYYVNGIGSTINLDQHICNLTAGFKDLALDAPNDCGFKVIRTWTILDWCWDDALYENIDLLVGTDDCEDNTPTFSDWENKSLTYEQHIILKDSESPEVSCPFYDPDGNNIADPLEFSVGPFNCEASFRVPAPQVLEDCKYTWTVEVYTEVPVYWNGVPTGEQELTLLEDAQIIANSDVALGETIFVSVAGIPYGVHYLNYVVSDECGNTAHLNNFDPSGDLTAQLNLLCEFEIVDQIEPVAVCDDQLNISITNGSSGFSGNGIGRVYAFDVDEGSWDNCGEVEIKVRRFVRESDKEAFEALSNLTLNTNKEILEANSSSDNGVQGYWTEWADYADFICADVNRAITVELGVWDESNNFNYCWLNALIEDKTAPICQAPKDITLSCSLLPSQINLPEDGTSWANLPEENQTHLLEWFETLDSENNDLASAFDNCSASVALTNVTFDIHCQSGSLVRYFQAQNASGVTSGTCSQTITLERAHDYCIIFPEDAEVECQGILEVPGIEFNEYECDLLALSIQDERFDVVTGEGCYKLFRTYRVLNWCQFEEDLDIPGGEDPDFTYFDRYTDIGPMVIGRDEDDDGNPGDEAVSVRFIGQEGEEGITEGTSYIGRTCDPDDGNPSINGGYWRSTDFAAGFYQYTQVIKVIDGTAPIIAGTGQNTFENLAGELDQDGNCATTISRTILVTEACTPQGISIERIVLNPDESLGIGQVLLYDQGGITNGGNSFNFAIGTPNTLAETGIEYALSGEFPFGSHEFEVSVRDDCGNVGFEVVEFTITDAKAVAPICIASLSVDLSPVDEDQDGTIDNGIVTVWASDFITSEVTDCSLPITYSIHRAAEVDAGIDIPSPGQTSLTVTCDDFEVVVVYVYAWDAAGNGDRCEALLLITGFEDLCSPTIGNDFANIAGWIATEEGRALARVGILLSGNQTTESFSSEEGIYSFDGLEKGADYSLVPILDEEHNNGVSTFDIVLISKHILGIEPLDSPYKLIAADVNRSNNVTTLDLIQIRKLILNITTEFSNNTSWRFVEERYQFPDPTKPWLESLPEAININDLQDDFGNKDFIAIKTGDVNLDAKTNSNESTTRQLDGLFRIHADDIIVEPSTITEIPLHVSDLNDIDGLQFTLEMAPSLELISIKNGLIQDKHLGLKHISDGIIMLSWDKVGRLNQKQEGVLLTLEVQTTNPVKLSDAIQLSSRYTKAEAYPRQSGIDDRPMDIALEFGGKTITASGFKLYQNVPNPYISSTVIGFELPSASKVLLKIYDVEGKLIKTIEGEYDKGYNKIVLDGQLSETSGLLYYTLETDQFRATKTMMLSK